MGYGPDEIQECPARSLKIQKDKEHKKMNHEILILNGAPKRNGSTARLTEAFIKGAMSAGNKVRNFHLYGMNIYGCSGCLHAEHDPKSPCIQKDDMELIYAHFEDADVIAFVSPLYFWTVTGTLKIAADRLYAEIECLGYEKFKKKSVLLMTAGGSDYSQALTWYRNYERNLGWKNLGEVLGAEKLDEAFRLGASL